MAKRQKTKRFSIQAYDNKHYQATEQYTRAVDALFDAATKAIAQEAVKGTYDPDKPFSYSDHPKVKSVMQNVTTQLASRLTTVIQSGSKKQWLFACEKNDGFIASIMDTSKLSKARLNKMQDRNLDALQAFQGRKVDGMNLSQRVWKYVGQYKEQMEQALDVGLGEGRSAQQLARDVKQNLREPNRLFRRVRDKRGNLVLSKNAQAYHPGRGVYRSSVKNAQRLTRSEINMAYRESDWQRWQTLDFVVGFEIMRSNHDPLCKCDLCEKLKGRYPKTFKFKGWHPQCMCYAIPILADEETFDENELGDLKAALHGTTYEHKAAKNIVVDVPQAFKDWVDEHKDAQGNWSSTPYFIKDNFKDGKLSEGLKFDVQTVQAQVANAVANASEYVPFVATTVQEATDFILNNIADSITLQFKKSDLPLLNQIMNQVAERMQQFGIPKFTGFGKPRSAKADASWDETLNTINFNLSRLRAGKQWGVNQKYVQKYGFEWSHYVDENDIVRQTIDHELGHRLYALFNMKRDAIFALGKAGVMHNGFNELMETIGYYAGTDEHEYFAEVFAIYMSKDHNRLVGYSKEMMDKFIAKVNPNAATAKIDPVQQELDALEPQVASIKQMCAEWGLNTYPLDVALQARKPKDVVFAITSLKNRIDAALNELQAYITEATQVVKDATTNKVDYSSVYSDLQTIKADKRDWVMGKAAIKQRLADLKAKILAAISGAHAAVLKQYDTNAQVDDTFKKINAEMESGERWFENGDLKLDVETRAGNNGSTWMDGRIYLTKQRLQWVKDALSKIGQGKADTITFDEADGMATFWHEITHNRNIPGLMRKTQTQTDVMEMMNEFVARKTLPEFYAKLGVKDVPHKEFINNRNSTGYNRRVLGYDFVIQKLGLDKDKVLESAKKNLFTLKYTEQETTAIQALLDGGLDKFKGANGKKIGKRQMNKIVALCRQGYSTTSIENYLKNEGILPSE